TFPALLLVGSKAMDRTIPPGFAQPVATIFNDYTTIPVGPARQIAGRHLAILTGLAHIGRFTPPDARILWMRPDYLALLGHRAGVPWYYREGMQGVVAQVRRTGARYLV